jgi:hypothetical protein
VRGWLHDFSLLWSVVLDFLGAFLLQSEQADWTQSGRVRDSCNLGSQVFLFLFEKEWVRENSSVEIAGEQNLNLSGCLDVLWSQIWKFRPLVEGLVRDPIGVFVNSSSLWLLVSWLFLLVSLLFAFCLTLSNVVILLSSSNLAEESKSGCA